MCVTFRKRLFRIEREHTGIDLMTSVFSLRHVLSGPRSPDVVTRLHPPTIINDLIYRYFVDVIHLRLPNSTVKQSLCNRKNTQK